MEIIKGTSLDNSKHSSIRIVEHQEPNPFGLNIPRVLKKGNLILQRTGGVGRPPDNRGTVNLRSRLKVKVTGKRSSNGVLESKLVDLIRKKENIDEKCMVDSDYLKDDEAYLVSTPVETGHQ